MFSRLIFSLVRFAARNGIAPPASPAAPNKKSRARQTGIRGETYAYWYLRRLGYIFIARNYSVPGLKGELDLVGFDGDVLAFVEVKTRSASDSAYGTPEDAVTPAKQSHIARVARRFLSDRRLHKSSFRFDVLAIESAPGRPPTVRLHKAAFSA